MKLALLDVNFLIGLAWPDHLYHPAAKRWFVENPTAKWVTCPLTEAGFVKLSANPAVVLSRITPKDAINALKLIRTRTGHIFWPLEHSVTEILPEIQARLTGYQQLTDALLLDLAIRKGGSLVTFDQRIGSLLAADSQHRASIEMIPAEVIGDE